MKAKTLTVAAVQMKFRPTVAENVATIVEFIQRASTAGADAVLFPECAVTGYGGDFREIAPRVINAALQTIGNAARAAKCNVLVGSPTYRGKQRFNSLVVFDRRGREVFRYSKIHLAPQDGKTFSPGNTPAFFHLDGIACTAIICHERRYPELVRLPVMMGAQIVFHPNAGLDALEVSKGKRQGRDGISVRAFENQVYYVFANTVGPQGNRLWSAGDSKIVAPAFAQRKADPAILAQADNRGEALIVAKIDLAAAGRKYAREALRQPAFLREHWKAMLAACKTQLKEGKPGSA